jgi:hypothetical protein
MPPLTGHHGIDTVVDFHAIHECAVATSGEDLPQGCGFGLLLIQFSAQQFDALLQNCADTWIPPGFRATRSRTWLSWAEFSYG